MVDYDRGAIFGDRYEDVYDQNGESVYTDCCGVYMMWDPQAETYFCPQCGKKISRKEFLDEYVEAYGRECYSCHTNYPQCVVCHKNHQDDLDKRERRI